MSDAFPLYPGAPRQPVRRQVPVVPTPVPLPPEPPTRPQPGVVGRRAAGAIPPAPVPAAPQLDPSLSPGVATGMAMDPMAAMGGTGGYQSEMTGVPMLDAVGGPMGDYGYNILAAGPAIWEDPSFMMPDIMPGLDPLSAGYAQLTDLPVDAGALFSIMGGAGTMGAGPEEMAGLYQNLINGMAGGNTMIDFGSILDQIRTAAPDSQLGFLMQHNPTFAGGAMKAALGGAAQMNFSPAVAGALNNMLPGMFAGMVNQSMKLSPEENVPGAVDPLAALNAGLSRLGF